MKKILLILWILLVLTGCSSQEAKEVYIDDLIAVCAKIEEQVAEDLEHMTDEELYGKSEEPEQQQEYFLKMTNSLKDKYLSNYDLKKNLKVRVTGTLSYAATTEEGLIFFRLSEGEKDQSSEAADLLCSTRDQSILVVEQDDYITIEGILFKTDRTTESISDCVLAPEAE